MSAPIAGLGYYNDPRELQQLQAMQQAQSVYAQQRAQELYERQRRAQEELNYRDNIGWGKLEPSQKTNLKVTGDLEVEGKIITKEKKMFGIYGSLKNYITKHSDLIFTVVLVMLADRWFFKGAFTNTLQSLVGKLVNRAHDEVDSKPLTVAK